MVLKDIDHPDTTMELELYKPNDKIKQPSMMCEDVRRTKNHTYIPRMWLSYDTSSAL